MTATRVFIPVSPNSSGLPVAGCMGSRRQLGHTPADKQVKFGDEMVSREYFPRGNKCEKLRVPGSLRSLLIMGFSLRYSG